MIAGGHASARELAPLIEPVYANQLSYSDGWGFPVLYWSDGGRFLLLKQDRFALAEQFERGSAPPPTRLDAAGDIAATVDAWCAGAGGDPERELLIVDGRLCP